MLSEGLRAESTLCGPLSVGSKIKQAEAIPCAWRLSSRGNDTHVYEFPLMAVILTWMLRSPESELEIIKKRRFDAGSASFGVYSKIKFYGIHGIYIFHLIRPYKCVTCSVPCLLPSIGIQFQFLRHPVVASRIQIINEVSADIKSPPVGGLHAAAIFWSSGVLRFSFKNGRKGLSLWLEEILLHS
jgi:hypothetical protein